MAKKGQTVQLQTELNTDEEWEKYLQRPGLLVIDIYSDWCGPCAGMQANLKKIKVEIGGDTLQLAIAKCDGITALERFRGTSEPTWMLVSNGKMVNFMYGANAPKLTRLITEELRLQKLVEEGTYNREQLLEVTERAPDEASRWEAVQAVIAEETALEEAKKSEEKHHRLMKESDAILENLGNLGVIVVLPHARDKYMEVMKELMSEAGLVISISEKMKINKEQLEGISYFLEEGQNLYLPPKSMESMYGADSQVMVVKASHGTADAEDPVSVRVLNVIYGAMRHPPGEEDCPHRKLIKYPSVQVIVDAPLVESQDDETANDQEKVPKATEQEAPQDTMDKEGSEDEEDNFIIGIWAPPTRRILSSCFKILFPRMAAPLMIPEPPPKPPYVAVCFNMDRRQKVQELMAEWDTQIERYGIFTSCIPEDAKLIAKTFKKFDKIDIAKDNTEKIVIQLARKKSECLLAFACEVPSYMSPNVDEGKRECKIFFPEGYDEHPDIDTEEEEGEDMDEGDHMSALNIEEEVTKKVTHSLESGRPQSRQHSGTEVAAEEPLKEAHIEVEEIVEEQSPESDGDVED